MLLPTLLSLVSLARLAAAYAPSPSPISVGYFGGWHVSQGFTPADVSWDKYNQVIYSFAITTSGSGLSLDGSDGEALPRFVKQAKKHGVKSLVSIGGWSGGVYWSTDVGSPKNRTAFVKTVLDFAVKYELDGLDFDWEYPGNQGLGCNTIAPHDVDHFLAFIQELRATPEGSGLLLTAATSLLPWLNAKGNPSKNLTGFGEALDYMTVMVYDIYGSWCSTAGPNAPLYSSCSTENDQGSAEIGIQAWIDAGIPPHKLLHGVPFYAHSFSVAPEDAFTKAGRLRAYPQFNASNQPLGDAWDNSTTPYTDVCGVVQPGSGGSFDFWGLVDEGFLTERGTPAPGIAYEFDNCSQTPAVYNATSEVWISFDNARSMKAKGEFVVRHGLAGFAVWEVASDYNDILLDSIRSAMGL